METLMALVYAVVGLTLIAAFTGMAMESRRPSLAGKLRAVVAVVGVLLLAVGGYIGLAVAPRDSMMGDVQRIMYVHVPAVWMALVALTVNFVASVAYMFKNSWKLDSLAEAAAEVGVLLGANGVLLGAIWGRPTWGVWWTWDPRLTTAAILLVAYSGYLALRKFVEDPERRAVWSAVVGIIAFVDIPILWFSVKWWRSLHQIQSTPQTVDRPMVVPLRISAFAFLLLMIVFIWQRYRISQHALEEEVALPDALPPERAPRAEVTP
ncbi:MAG: cytochrome c biogenesis protein CcsA [Myxococcaceae bacterium]